MKAILTKYHGPTNCRGSRISASDCDERRAIPDWCAHDRSNATVRDSGKVRRLVVTLYPGGVLGVRPERTRREERVSLESVWALGVRQRVAEERKAKLPRRRKTH